MTRCTPLLVGVTLLNTAHVCGQANPQWQSVHGASSGVNWVDRAADIISFQNSVYVTGEAQVASNTRAFGTAKYPHSGSGSISPSAVAYFPTGPSWSAGVSKGVAIDAAVVDVEAPPSDESDDGGGTIIQRPTIFVTGPTPGSNGLDDYKVIAYDENLSWPPIWQKTFDRGGADTPVDIATDGVRVAVTGTSHNGTINQIVTVCYDAVDGDVLWSHATNGTHTGAGAASGVAVTLEMSSDVTVTGRGYDGIHTGVLTCVYDPAGSSGSPVIRSGWPQFWRATGYGDTSPTCMVKASGHGVYIAGMVNLVGRTIDTVPFVLGYATNTTGPIWADVISMPTGSTARAASIDRAEFKDPTNIGSIEYHVYVTGWAARTGTGYDVMTWQYEDLAASTPSTRQIKYFDSNGYADQGLSLDAVQGCWGSCWEGPDLYVAASSITSSGTVDIMTLKYETEYDPLTGVWTLSNQLFSPVPVWAGTAGGVDSPVALHRDPAAPWYWNITGRTATSSNGDEYVTLRYLDYPNP